MTAAIYDFPAVIAGDTFTEKKMEIIINGTPMDLTEAKVELLVTINGGTNKVYEIPTTITNTIGGALTINQWKVHLHPHRYEYQFKITQADGTTLTYMKGELPILKTVK